MCGIAGIVDLRAAGRVDRGELSAMTETLVHRGPDASGLYTEPDFGLGVRRLRVIDLETGDQPIFNEDRSIVLVCNGEIFNYRELRDELVELGHVFRTRTDVEVLVHLYEEHGVAALERLNGQFAFALLDRRERRLFLARDHFGISPLYYAVADGHLLFASEVKAILKSPAAPRGIDPAGLDQVLSLPGPVSPRTVFSGVRSLPPGHFLLATAGRDEEPEPREYWDLEYPREEAGGDGRPDGEWLDELAEVFERSVRRRLQADVPVGLFVSGGLDSSLVAAVTARVSPEAHRHSFSISFADEEIDETRYQRLVTRALGCDHHEIAFDDEAIVRRLERMVYHCECPVKETFNTCALALSEAVRDTGVKVVLGGQGADELFGGYPGYRFDASGMRRNGHPLDVEAVMEEELRDRLWGDRDLFYEQDLIAFREVTSALYSERLNEALESSGARDRPLVDRDRVRGRHAVHQRSYLDLKLRLADHLLTDHGDRMVMAHSVEGRYPFLDQELVDLVRRMPPRLKVNDMTDKYAVRRIAEGLVPRQVLEREKFGFRAPGSPFLLQRRVEWVEDLLSPARIERQGYFDPGVVARLKSRYSREGFRLNPHLEPDLLMVVLTFNLLSDLFELPDLS